MCAASIRVASQLEFLFVLLSRIEGIHWTDNTQNVGTDQTDQDAWRNQRDVIIESPRIRNGGQIQETMMSN